MEWATVQQGPPWAVDSWGLGCMMQVGWVAAARQDSAATSSLVCCWYGVGFEVRVSGHVSVQAMACRPALAAVCAVRLG